MGGADLLGADTISAFPIYSGGAVKMEGVPVSGRTFTQAWRVTGLVKLEQSYLSQLSARSVGGPAHTEFVFKSNDTYDKSATVGVQLSPQCRLYSVPFRSKLDYAAGTAVARFRLGYDQQSFELGGVVLKNDGPGLPLSSLPTAGFTYAGRSVSAPWRVAASVRTEQLRKGDVTVKVVDKSGHSISGAAIRLEMQRHAFSFGSEVAVERLFENSADGQKYQAIILTLFNRVVLGNALK